MDITRIVLEMISKRVDDCFSEALDIVEALGKKVDETRAKNKEFFDNTAARIAKEAEEKLEREILKKFPKATFEKSNWRTTPCFDVESGCELNVEYDYGKRDEFYVLRNNVLEKCKQIAIENGTKTAFGEIDKYLETIDPVKILKLK